MFELQLIDHSADNLEESECCSNTDNSTAEVRQARYIIKIINAYIQQGLRVVTAWH